MLHRIALILVVVLSGTFTSSVWAQEQEASFIKYKNILIPIAKPAAIDNQAPRFLPPDVFIKYTSGFTDTTTRIMYSGPLPPGSIGLSENFDLNLIMLDPLSGPVEKWEVVKATDDDYDSDICPFAEPLPFFVSVLDIESKGRPVLNSSAGILTTPGIANLVGTWQGCVRASNEYGSSIQKLVVDSNWHYL